MNMNAEAELDELTVMSVASNKHTAFYSTWTECDPSLSFGVFAGLTSISKGIGRIEHKPSTLYKEYPA